MSLTGKKIGDKERPFLLSKQGFEADPGRLAVLGLVDRFSRIHQANQWGSGESVSGRGSEHRETSVIRRELPSLLNRLGVKRLLDAPCGDGNWISHAGLQVDYIGADIVPALIERLSERARAGEIRGRYLVADITRDALPEADAVLCRDCLVHLSLPNIGRAIERFQSTGANWLLATTFPELQAYVDCDDGDWRPLNFERPPFSWGAPVELLIEGCKLANGGWRDKSLGVWRLQDLARG